MTCDYGGGDDWRYRALITRFDRATRQRSETTTTVRERVEGIAWQATMDLCHDAITEDIAWQEKRQQDARQSALQQLAAQAQELDMGYGIDDQPS